jgi:hypothetical protein
MLPPKSVIVAVILFGMLTWLAVQRHNLVLSKIGVRLAQTQELELEQRIATATATKEAERRAVRDAKEAAWAQLARLKEAEEDLARIDPEARWAVPVADGPRWDDRSPYVWLSKTTLTTLPGSPFTDRAEDCRLYSWAQPSENLGGKVKSEASPPRFSTGLQCAAR